MLALNSISFSFNSQVMDNSRPTTGLSLEEFTKGVPPGWRTNIKGYTFRRYMQKLKLWWRITDEDDWGRVGPLIVSRPQGTIFKAAMSFTITRTINGVKVVYRGDEAVALPPLTAIQNNGVEEQAGIRTFLNQQKAIYELHDQDRVGIVLDSFFDCQRGNLDIPTWISQFELAYEDAMEEGGLVMNDVGKSHFLLKLCGMGDNKLDDIRLHVGGDLNQYRALVSLMMRTGKHDQTAQHG